MKIYNLVVTITLVLLPLLSTADTSVKKLSSCKDTPNCISSQVMEKSHYIAPFKISGDPKLAWQAFRKAIMTHDRIVITHETDSSLHAQATSLVLSFTDDIDAILNEQEGVIHIRSASRLKHDDFGISRKRLELLRTQLTKSHVLVKWYDDNPLAFASR